MNDRLATASKQYHRLAEDLERMLAEEMAETYRLITGRKPSDRMIEALIEAIRVDEP